MSATISTRQEPIRRKPVAFVKDGDGTASYLAEIHKTKNLTLAEEQKLAERIQAGDKQAMNILVEANLKFVVSVCRNYRNKGMPMADLISEGNLGLIRAAQRFDGTMNFKFISYAVWWIRQGILAAKAEQTRVLNVSAGRVGILYKISKANQKLAQNLGREPSPAELAGEMRMSENFLTECQQLASFSVSITAPAPGETEGCMEDTLCDDNAAETDHVALQYLLGANLKDLLGTLEAREQLVLKMYFGIGSQVSHTLEEIADRLGLTRERIRQIKKLALLRLRHPSRSHRLTAFQT